MIIVHNMYNNMEFCQLELELVSGCNKDQLYGSRRLLYTVAMEYTQVKFDYAIGFSCSTLFNNYHRCVSTRYGQVDSCNSVIVCCGHGVLFITCFNTL